MILHNPWALALIPIAALILFWAEKRRRHAGLRFSNHELAVGLPESYKVKISRNLFYVRILAVALMIFALARPQAVTGEKMIIREGIDIVLAVDVSTSMLAEDVRLDARRKNRIETARDVIRDFVAARKNDRIGMVAFALRPYTICPLTLDHGWLARNLDRVEVGMIEDGTAIGAGLLSAMNRFPDRDTREKVIILLTDGRNNAGEVAPDTAAQAARTLKIKVYAVGVGSRGQAFYPVADPFGKTRYQPVDVDLDEDALRFIAEKTGAAYFRAADAQALQDIYGEIDRLEKRRIEERIYYAYEELYPIFLIPGLLLLFFGLFLQNTSLRRLP